MAQISIAGNSFVITSSVSMADLETVKKYRPTALTIVDEESKETLFRLGIGSASSINDNGISFSGTSNDEKRLATATIPIPSEALADGGDAKEYVLDRAGIALANLNKIETALATTIADIKKERDTVAANIKVIV
jgi:hypothetical protein